MCVVKVVDGDVVGRELRGVGRELRGVGSRAGCEISDDEKKLEWEKRTFASASCRQLSASSYLA